MLKTLRQNTNTNRFKTKIYIKEINPNSLKQLNDYLVKKEVKIHVYSDEGIFSLEGNNIFKLKPIDKPIVSMNYGDYTLLFDDSEFEKEHVFSQIPGTHIVQSFTRKYYSLNKTYNTLLQLVIEETNGIAFNFYFFLNDAYFFDNILVKKELNGFLSMLN